MPPRRVEGLPGVCSELRQEFMVDTEQLLRDNFVDRSPLPDLDPQVRVCNAASSCFTPPLNSATLLHAVGE